MNKNLLFIACLFVPFISYSQESQAVFPDDFLGVYKGKLHIYNIQGGTQEIPMEFRLGKTDSANHYNYVLVYDGQARNYTLVIKDLEQGICELDENNGIVLPTSLKDNILSSIFQVGNTLLVSRMEFSDHKLSFEIITTREDQKMETGKETGFEVYGYPLTGRQKAVLYKQDTNSEM